MNKYWIVFKKSLKSETIYRAATLSGVAGSLLGFFMQVFLWKALLGAGVRQDTSFSDMLLYVIINSFMLELTRTNVAAIIENSMIDGTISMELLRPMSYKTYLLTSALGKNTYGTLTRTIPALIISAFFVKGVSIPDLYSFLLFVVSAFLGILLMFEVTYLAGLLAFWLQRCWFIEFYLMGFERIFGGTMIPIWFYPEFLKKMSFFLPFRYMTFEPINFFLGKTPATEAWLPVLMALFWLVVLNVLDRCMWQMAVKRLTVNGG